MMNSVINNSNPDEMRKASKKIEMYAANLKEDMKRLLQNHQAMRSSWVGKQYNDFSKVIEDANDVIKKQAEELLRIAQNVKEEADQLEKAQNVGLR